MPQPVSQEVVKGKDFTFDARTRIAVLSKDPAAVGVGTYLARRLAPATGHSFPVVTPPRTVNHAVVLDPNGPEGLGAEGYTLTSGKNGILVQAHGAEGLFRGVQTLRQLLPAEVESRTVQPGPWSVPAVRISDAPRYAYRGAMLDVARRFYPVDQVKRFIDQAAAYKINTLHLTDDQGWRIAIDEIPSLTQVGASTQSGFTGGQGWFYSAADYKEIIAHAKSRFICARTQAPGRPAPPSSSDRARTRSGSSGRSPSSTRATTASPPWRPDSCSPRRPAPTAPR
ncbi:family 20 glycosylhydrolase [Streptomyces lateritius]|nr:family 20 glycosylhydrolase [Streptomyces lateritius]